MRGPIIEILAGIAAIILMLAVAHIGLIASQTLWGIDITAWIFG